MTDQQLKKLESGSPLERQAAEFIRGIVNSPFYDGYLAVRHTIDTLNLELQKGASKIVADEGEEKQFDRAHKYITEIQPYYEQLDYFRNKMLPKDVEKAEEVAADLLDQARLNYKKLNGSKV